MLHLEEVTDKAFRKIIKFLRMVKNCKVNFEAIKKIYSGVYGPIVTYATAAWIDRLGVKGVNKLLSEQRRVLLRMVKGYRALSGDACLVLPMDLEIRKRCALREIRSKGSDVINGKIFGKEGCRKKVGIMARKMGFI